MYSVNIHAVFYIQSSKSCFWVYLFEIHDLSKCSLASYESNKEDTWCSALCCGGRQALNWTIRCSPHQLCHVRASYLIGFCSPSGACVNSSVSGDSPLHIAARLSSPELVSVLLDHGANRSLRNSEGKQPLDLAPPNSLVERLLRQVGGRQPKLTK